ncbi:MAG: Protein phosphatase 2C [Syntrophorhabdus sp. PtaU1.Bin002]|nr:MAG: Protein phosphatase 2C [Syntrophorhabdus sp. PtaU1.Bin002]
MSVHSVVIRVGISEDVGCRDAMEDEHAIYQVQEKAFFSAEIYDGHGGRRVAQVAAEMLTPYFLHGWSLELAKQASERRPERELVREAYLEVDKHVGKVNMDGGTTAAMLYVIGDRFIGSNVGDTRIVLGVQEGVFTLTLDHKPDLPEELERIEEKGGSVVRFGVARVQGILAVSRAIGDRILKPFVTAEPRIVEGYLARENDYAIIACDGVWDVLTPEIVIELARGLDNPQMAADAIKESALDNGTTDNVSVIVLDLRKYTADLPRQQMEVNTVTDRAYEK